MKILHVALIFLALATHRGHAKLGSSEMPRQVVSLDAGWRFLLGDPTNATNPAYDDHDWRHLDVPHDYVIEGRFTETNPFVISGDRATWYTLHGSLPIQPAWYRKTLSLPPAAKGKRLWLEFDGVFSNSRYWLNGREISSEFSGYNRFQFDITDAVRFDADNILAVRVDPHYDGWWYEGGGIYRHVRLVILDPLHVVPQGIFIAPNLADPGDGVRADATLAVHTDITNEAAAATAVSLLNEILDPDGKVVLAQPITHTLDAGADANLAQALALSSAKLWSPDHPCLYHLRTTLTESGKIVDQLTTDFGIRQVRFDAQRGFFLNGQRVKLKGVDVHGDHAGVGVAMPDRLIQWRLERLKEVGCNAIRLSHNPVEPVMLDFCDRLGFLVIAENRHLGDTYADQTPKETPAVEHRDLTNLVRHDRNHPSIILWSLCNEQWTQGSPEGAAMVLAMKQRVRELDPTRLVTAAMNGGFTATNGFASVLDVVGFNYNPWVYAPFHGAFPDRPVVATEIASEVGTRGIYDLKHWDNYWGDRDCGYVAAYSINAGPGGQTVEQSWPPVATNEFMAGGFVWSGFDYKGEPRPFVWPCINSHYGIMDLCGFPKDSYYYYQSWWTEKPVLHLFPHWNWPGREGREIPVWVHSNCQEVELFLNGVSQGRQTVTPLHHLEWKVKYAPGRLVARGLRNGKTMETVVETTGAPAAIRLTADRVKLIANQDDLAVVTVAVTDAHGRVVPVAGNEIHFNLSGPARLIGVGNGDPSSHEPDQADRRSAFNGLAQAIVQTTAIGGKINLKAEADGLKSQVLTLTSK